MDANTCPCKDCVAPKRHSGCHSTCKEYKEWDAIHKQNKAKIYATHRADDDCFPNRYRNGKNRRR